LAAGHAGKPNPLGVVNALKGRLNSFQRQSSARTL
jgi:hypothetical protein